MKAIGFRESLPINDPESFIAFEAEKPSPSGYDLLVKVAAIAVNPIDFKMRMRAAKDTILDTPRIIGWDAVGTVEAVGERSSRFSIGDEVYYAGDLNRSGSNAEYQLVDERIVGRKPTKLSVAEAAAMPLTSLTAYEALFDRIRINPKTDRGKTLLVLAVLEGSVRLQFNWLRKLAT